MPVPKYNQRAVNKYVKKNYDRINVTMPKGKREIIQEHAKQMGESTNGFINRAIDNQMEQDNASKQWIIELMKVSVLIVAPILFIIGVRSIVKSFPRKPYRPEDYEPQNEQKYID